MWSTSKAHRQNPHVSGVCCIQLCSLILAKSIFLLGKFSYQVFFSQQPLKFLHSVCFSTSRRRKQRYLWKLLDGFAPSSELHDGQGELHRAIKDSKYPRNQSEAKVSWEEFTFGHKIVPSSSFEKTLRMNSGERNTIGFGLCLLTIFISELEFASFLPLYHLKRTKLW